MAEFGKLDYVAKKTRAVPGYLTVARMRRTVTIPSERSRPSCTQSVPSRSPFRSERSEKLSLGIGLHSWYGLNAGPDQRAANETLHLHSDILAGAFRNAYSPTIGTACLPRCSCLQRFLTRSRSISFSPSQNKSEPGDGVSAKLLVCIGQTELSA